MIGVLILASALAYHGRAVPLAAEVHRASGDSACCAGSAHSENVEVQLHCKLAQGRFVLVCLD